MLIVGRVREIAMLFAILTLCWVAVDAALLSEVLWHQLMVGRAVTSLAFILLARSCSRVTDIAAAYRRVFSLFAIPVAFLVYADSVLHFARQDTDSLSLAMSYFYAPYILASGLGFFPLTVTEATMLLGLPVTLVMSALALAFPAMTVAGSSVVTIWILLLIVCTSSLAGVSQLGFMLQLFEDRAHDGLTGLLVRPVGEELLNQQFEAAARQNVPFTVLFLDLDHFKRVNDQFGHDAGDTVLNGVANHLKGTLRRQDIAIRWGGEEFVIALPGTDHVQARGFLQRLAAAGLGVTPDGKPVTASIGVAEYQADRPPDCHALVALADKRTYEAKTAGRNCYFLLEERHPFLQ